MPKIVYAPILEQAGFLKRKAAAVVEQWVYRLDGASQYLKLTAPINLIPLDVVEIDFIGGAVSNGFAAFIGTTNFAVRFDVDTTKSFLREQGLDATLNGISVNSGSTQVPESGENKASLLVSSSGVLEEISSIAGSRLMNLPVYNLRVIRNGTVINEIPLTNKSQGATQLATVGNVNATIINFTEDGWEKP